MGNGWDDMGDLSAAKEFQRQLRHGDLKDNRRPRRAAKRGREGGDEVSSFAANRSSTGRNNTVTWGGKLATAPPAHLFKALPTPMEDMNQPARENESGEPMLVDYEQLNCATLQPHRGIAPPLNPGSVPGMMGVTSTAASRAQPAPAGAGAGAVPSAPATVSGMTAGGGLGASKWNQSTSTATLPLGDIVEPGLVIPKITTTKIADTLNASTTVEVAGSTRGLQQSRWADPAPKSQGMATIMNTQFGQDRGRVVDDDWMLTYQVEDGGRIYSLAAYNAREAGDKAAYLSLHNVAELSAKIVIARTMLHDTLAEKRARDAANAAARLAEHAFHKHHPPLPKEIVHENTTFHSTITQAQGGYGGDYTHPDASVQVRSQPVEPAADHTYRHTAATASLSVRTGENNSHVGGSGHPTAILDQRHGYSEHVGRADVADPPSTQSLSSVNRKDSSFQSIPQTRPVQKQPEMTQDTHLAPQHPINQDSIPSNFDDPRARELLENFFNLSKK